MDETADLIRLLAEAPMEEPPMSRPKELLDRYRIERVVQEGVVQPGPAVPGAQAREPQSSSGSQAAPSLSTPQVGAVASPSPPMLQVGAVANPQTGMPDVGMQVSIKQVQQFAVGEARVMSVPTAAGRVATPVIMEQLAGLPANVKSQAPIEAKASPTPRTNVTVVVPPAFPMDPAEAFRMVDEMELPPWKGSDRDVPVFQTDAGNLESTEQLVARSYMAAEGNRSDVDRWSL